MAEELQQLLEKIQHDGVEKANAEAAAILAKAKADAAAVLKDAETKAAALRAQAETDARAFEERARKTISQAARDTVLDVKASLGKLFDKLLAQDVSAALADPAEAARLALAAVKDLGAVQAQGPACRRRRQGRAGRPRRDNGRGLRPPPRRRARGIRLLRSGDRRRACEAPPPRPRQARVRLR